MRNTAVNLFLLVFILAVLWTSFALHRFALHRPGPAHGTLDFRESNYPREAR